MNTRRGSRDKEAYVFGLQPVLLSLEKSQVRRVWCARSDGGRTRLLLDRAKELGVPVEGVDRRTVESKAGSPNHQGVVALLVSADPHRNPTGTSARPGRVLAPGTEAIDAQSLTVEDLLVEAAKTGRPPLLLLLDEIQDPHNLGALARSAYAFGAHGLVIPKNRSARLTPAVVRASAGAALHLPIVTVTNLKHATRTLQEHGVRVVAANMSGAPASESDLTGPLALILGSEGKGVRRTVNESSDFAVSIPMVDFDSLNVSVAGGILLYEVLRQRRQTPKA